MSEESLSQSPVQNGNPYNLVDHPNASTDQVNQNTDTVSSVKKESGQFFKKLIKTIAKMAGLPDPETGEPAKATTIQETKPSNNDSVNPDTTLEQDVVAQEKQDEEKKQEEEKKKFSFESVMSGVTGVLDKIEKKVEEKTGIDLDAPLKKREEKPNEQEGQPSTESGVEKNNEEYLSENH